MADRKSSPSAGTVTVLHPQSAGDRLVVQLRESLPQAPEGMQFEWNELEVAIIDNARRQADDIELLEAALAEQGLTVEGSKGQQRLNPIVAELRLSRLALLRMLSELRMPDAGPMKNVTKQRAAQTRWARERRSDA